MNNDPVDLLQIKIENAKKNLSDDTLNAIAAVDWKAVILSMREKKGYSFEQLGDLELETELLLCGLSSPEDYPRELEKRMGISRAAANELVNEMNELVFKKIREELIKNAERKKIFQKRNEAKTSETGSPDASTEAFREEIDKTAEGAVLKATGIEVVQEPSVNEENNLSPNDKVEKRENILEKIENPEGAPARNASPSDAGGVHPILQQKIVGSVQMPVTKTEYALGNLSSNNTDTTTPIKNKIPKADPYRELPE